MLNTILECSIGDIQPLSSALESISAGGLAMSLAYLNMERFRYRTKIRESAGSETLKLEKMDGYEHCEKLEQVKIFKYLSGLKDNDDLGKVHGKQAKFTFSLSLSLLIYNLLFDKHIDRKGGMCFVLLCAFVLVIGVAHSIGISFAESWFSASWIRYWFALMTISIAYPLLMMLAGWYVVKRLISKGSAAAQQITEVLASQAAAAKMATPDD